MDLRSISRIFYLQHLKIRKNITQVTHNTRIFSGLPKRLRDVLHVFANVCFDSLYIYSIQCKLTKRKWSHKMQNG